MKNSLYLQTCSLALLALVACSPQTPSETKPIEFADDTQCALDGMLLSEHGGPKAQIHYHGQSQPEFYCDTVEFVNIVTAAERKTHITGLFVQDMGSADWDKPRGYWIPAKSAIFVYGSSKHGSMGPTIATFSERSNAEHFAHQYGGKLLSFDQLNADMAVLDGHTLHDHGM